MIIIGWRKGNKFIALAHFLFTNDIVNDRLFGIWGINVANASIGSRVATKYGSVYNGRAALAIRDRRQKVDNGIKFRFKVRSKEINFRSKVRSKAKLGFPQAFLGSLERKNGKIGSSGTVLGYQ